MKDDKHMLAGDSLHLLPHPRKLTPAAGSFTLPKEGTIGIAGDREPLLSIAGQLQAIIQEAEGARWDVEVGPSGQEHARLILDSSLDIPPQGYRLAINPERIEIAGADAAGVFYGVTTLKQILRQCSGGLPCCEIEDWPDHASRGVMLDISRDKVPKLETLFSLIDDLCEWKVNHFELYTEHTFAYRNHKDVWAQASPMTAEDIRKLDAYCRERFVELVPNQNSFGHFARWLKCPRYRHLAECPDGFVLHDGRPFEGPFSLNPTDSGSLVLLRELYAELLPNFSSKNFHVGFDETWDVGQGRSKTECERKGRGRVFLDFLLEVNELVKSHGRTMHYWPDMILNYFPELIPELPRDAVAVDWGYIAAYPFGEHGKVFREAGVPFQVASGTSTWGTISGCSETAWGNNRNASVQGKETGALGIVNTDWGGDAGHWHYYAISLLPYALGASQAWCVEANTKERVLAAADRHVFKDSAGVMAQFAWDMGCTWTRTGHDMTYAIVLSWIIQNGIHWERDDRVTSETLHQTREHVEQTMAALSRARMGRRDAETVIDEYENCARFLYHGCELGLAILDNTFDNQETRLNLGSQMREILGEHRRLWCVRNRIGGLHDSTRTLEKRLAEYDEAP